MCITCICASSSVGFLGLCTCQEHPPGLEARQPTPCLLTAMLPSRLQWLQCMVHLQYVASAMSPCSVQMQMDQELADTKQ